MTLRIAVLQQSLAWQAPEQNRRQFAEWLQPLHGALDVIVLPEMFTTGFTMEPEAVAEAEDGPTVEWLRQQARAADAAVTGSIVVQVGEQYVNRLLWVTPDGAVSHYDKRHLFRMAEEHRHYAPGRKTLLVEWRGARIAPLVCYDLRFPVWSRRRASFNYDVLLYVANWPAVRRYPWQQLLRARAIENQAFVIGGNRVGADGNGVEHAGDSVVLDYLGKPLAELPDVPGIVRATVDLDPLREYRERFPAHLDADRFTLDP
jgi:predicted amidohydrolase